MRLLKALEDQMPDGFRRLSTGGDIDRTQPISFEFNGVRYYGYQGDTLASALIANGEKLTARSFKYHRPRGIIGAGSEEPSSLVELLGDAASGNQPITTVLLREGLRAVSVNCWPSPKFDLLSVNQLLAKFIPAAFYYKTFWDLEIMVSAMVFVFCDICLSFPQW